MSHPGYTWKVYERRGAKYFGCERNPLSGISSGHDTHSDSLHPDLYLEGKSAKAKKVNRNWIHQLWDLFKSTSRLAKAEDKTSIIHLHQGGATGFLLVIHSYDMPYVVDAYLKARGLVIAAQGEPCPNGCGSFCACGSYVTIDPSEVPYFPESDPGSTDEPFILNPPEV